VSHVVSSEAIITDLDCLKAVLHKFPGLRWKEGQKKYHWAGRWYNDYSKEDAAYKRGIDVKDYGKSEHVLHLDNTTYEIGVCKRKDGQGYSLVWDFVGDGYKLSDAIGKNAEKLMCEYAKEYCTRYAQEMGMMMTSTTTEDGNTLVEMIQV
jgi:hypothetical protein